MNEPSPPIHGTTLSKEQLESIEKKRVEAILKRKEKERLTQPTSGVFKRDRSRKGPLSLPCSSIGSNIDYDLTKMKDTKGGFFMMAEKDEERTWKKEYSGLASYYTDLGQCREQNCPNLEIDSEYKKYFGVEVCRSCKSKFLEKYALLTKTEVKEDYLLTDSELNATDVLPCVRKSNPKKRSWNDMRLYLRFQVEAFALSKWGSEKCIDEEIERRELEKKSRIEKKFRQQLNDLRHRTQTSVWRESKNHEHEFLEQIYDSDKDQYSKTCTLCGFQVTYEVM